MSGLDTKFKSEGKWVRGTGRKYVKGIGMVMTGDYLT